ncbi:MAG: hypothetical protein AB1611_07330 [bacterium]
MHQIFRLQGVTRNPDLRLVAIFTIDLLVSLSPCSKITNGFRHFSPVRVIFDFSITSLLNGFVEYHSNNRLR